MSVGTPKRYIVDETGKQVGVILSIEEYQALIRLQRKPARRKRASAQPSSLSLYGALRHLGGSVAPTDELDADLRQLWLVWDRNSTP